MIHGIKWESSETFLNDNLLNKDILKIISKIQRIWHLVPCGVKPNITEQSMTQGLKMRLEQQDSPNSKNYSSQWRWYSPLYWWNFFGRPEHDRISETGLFSHSRRPKMLASSSASTIDDLMLREKKGPRLVQQNCQERLRIPRTHSKAGSDRKERKSQRRISRRTGRVSTYTT